MKKIGLILVVIFVLGLTCGFIAKVSFPETYYFDTYGEFCGNSQKFEEGFNISKDATHIEYYQKKGLFREYAAKYAVNQDIIETNIERIAQYNIDEYGYGLTVKEYEDSFGDVRIPSTFSSKDTEEYIVVDYNMGNQWTYCYIMDANTGTVIETLYESGW